MLNLWLNPYVTSLAVFVFFWSDRSKRASKINVFIELLQPETMTEGIVIMSSSAMTRLVEGSSFDTLCRNT